MLYCPLRGTVTSIECLAESSSVLNLKDISSKSEITLFILKFSLFDVFIDRLTEMKSSFSPAEAEGESRLSLVVSGYAVT